MVTCMTVALLLLQYSYYNTVNRVMVLRSLLPENVTFLTSQNLFPFLLEAVITAIHPFPGIESVSTTDPMFLIVCNLAMFLRIYLIARALKYRSDLNSNNGRFISALTNVEFTSGFAIKTEVRQRPWSSIVVASSLLLVS